MNLALTPKPLFLTPRDEEILEAVYRYRYVTSLDIAYLLFRPLIYALHQKPPRPSLRKE
jgi:hypothetical protein